MASWSRYLLLAWTVAFPATAEELIERDGTKRLGTLSLAAGKWMAGGVALEQVASVRFTPAPEAIQPAALWHRVQLVHGDEFTAELLQLDAKHLSVRTAWAAKLAIPRGAVARVTHLGGQPILHELFHGPLQAWQVTGDLQANEGQLRFTRDGQRLEHTLAQPVGAGVVTLTCVPTQTKTRRAVCELEFVRDNQPNLVQLEWCGPSEWLTVTAEKPAYANRLRRTGAGQQVRVEFDHATATILVGEHVLWSGTSPPGALRRIRCSAMGLGNEPATLTQLTLTVPAPNLTMSWADLTSDAIRTPNDSERFGTLQSLSMRELHLQSKPPSLPFVWTKVREFTFRRDEYPLKATQGEHVQAHWRSVGPERDVLFGAVTSWDAKTLTLQHAILGPLTMPRSHLTELRLRHFGVVLPVSATPQHLGTRQAFGFAVPKPTSTTMTQAVTLDTVPEQCTLLIEAAQVQPHGTPCAIVVNGTRVDTLNRHVDGPSAVARVVRIPLPLQVLRRDKNEIELRLEIKDHQQPTGVDVRSLRLELAHPR